MLCYSDLSSLSKSAPKSALARPRVNLQGNCDHPPLFRSNSMLWSPQV